MRSNVMRLILLRSVMVAIVVLATWILAGAKIAMLLDKLGTVADLPLPTGNYELSATHFVIGPRRWILDDQVAIANDARGRMTLSRDGRTFSFGAVTGGRGEEPGSYFLFQPDPSDSVSFVRRRSGLAWPIPFRFSIMGVSQPTWQRHSYRTLVWRKRSGATITMVWRDRQSFFARSGWADGNLEFVPTVAISASPHEAVIARYLLTTKSWQHAEYSLEQRDAGDDTTCDFVAVIHRADASARSPGSGSSLVLCIDRTSRTVSREIAAQ